ncbi:MAG: dihydroneopterin aldolase family protein [Euryarchaeota archaeon]|nr:dihydroneopterin aldolase family protein [Euryarchaeota archaeon]
MWIEGKVLDRDIAVFEAGIKLGALYHQFIGTPVSTATAEELGTAIEKSVSLQPWVSSVEVKIDREKVRENENECRYCELRGEMLGVNVVVLYEEVEVHARVRYEEDMGYPLMRVEKVLMK